MGRLTIVGLGLAADDLTVAAARALTSGARVLLRTENCACAQWLREQGVAFTTFDAAYRQAEDFDQLNETIAREVLRAAAGEDVVFAVADLRDACVDSLCAARAVDLIAGVPVEGALYARLPAQYAALAACDCMDFEPHAEMATLVREIDSRPLASEVKLRLMERYPEEWPLTVRGADGALFTCPLEALDRLNEYDHRVAALVPAVQDVRTLERGDFAALNRIVRTLRGPGGCPWDREQTHASLKANAVEEAYEVVEAIERADPDALYDELGDMLLQISLHAEIAREHGEFTVDDVTTAICQKMIARHPHIFGQAKAENSQDVLTLWEAVKKDEKHLQSQTDVMRAVTKSLPALFRARKVLKKGDDVGYQKMSARAAASRVEEALKGIESAGEEGLGELLLEVARLARWLDVQPELALNAAVDRYIARFERLEARLKAEGRTFADITPEWEKKVL